MKVLLSYRTAIGTRTIVAEGGDLETARAIAEAHRTLGQDAYTMEDQGRYDLRAHLKRHKAKLAKAALKGENIVQLQPRKEKP